MEPLIIERETRGDFPTEIELPLESWRVGY
jgi:hypothetical protein